MTPLDQKLYADLVGQGLRLDRPMVTNFNGLMHAARAANGPSVAALKRGAKRGGASAPVGERHEQSPYWRLIRLCLRSSTFDAIWRQMVIDAAHEVKRDMEMRGYGAAFDEGKCTPPPAKMPVPLPINGAEKEGAEGGAMAAARRFRKDIDG